MPQPSEATDSTSPRSELAESPPAARRALVIRNPVARRRTTAEAIRVAASARAPGWQVEVQDTAAPGDAGRLAAAAATSGVEVILACGGDGTVNEVLTGLRAAGRLDIPVGVLPGGTANVWAVEAGIPRRLADAMALLDGGRIVALDLGVARLGEVERPFLLMCGVGLDASAVEIVQATPNLKRWLAQGAFVAAGARALLRHRAVEVEVEAEVEVEVEVDADADADAAGADGPERASNHSLLLAVFGNSRLYGGVSRLTSAAEMDDGLIDLALFETREGGAGLVDGLGHVARAAWRLGRGWHEVSSRRFAYQRAPRFELRPRRPLGVQIDGEWAGTCSAEVPLQVEVERRAARLLVPPGENPLFPGR